MKWFALFSQTGSEIYQVSERLGCYPDMVLCNKQDDLDSINQDLIGKVSIIFTDKNPTVEQYLHYLPDDALVTMHGWLRIVPGEVCEKRTIYNGHPGLITKYPELKGKDPQKKAVQLKHATAGCIIHQATAELDGGPIVAESKEVSINGWYEDEEWVIQKLHKVSVDLWTEFLKDKLA
jgi:folate-dependent phosphoribosylglycinamide formyltransferase PurN